MVRCMFRRLLLSAFVGVCAPMPGGMAIASSCSNVDVAPDDFLREVDVLFEGQLVQTRPGDMEGCRKDCTISTFRVVLPLKGLLSETVDIGYKIGVNEAELTSVVPAPSPSPKVMIAAYRDKTGMYYSGGCSQYIVGQGQNKDAILQRARENFVRTIALTRPADSAPDRRLLLMSLQWFTDYRSHEAGLDAADKLLALEPGDREGLLFREYFLSALDRDQEALEVLDQLLARDPNDSVALQRRILALIRLDRMSEVPSVWRDFSGLKASDLDFGGRDLAGASFRNARLTKVNFKDAVLRDADFSGSQLHRVDLSAADLTRAKFDRSNLRANFSSALLVRSSFDRATGFPDFSNADVSEAIFTFASFDGSSFVGAKGHGAVFAGSCLRADFSGADLTGADLHGSQLLAMKWDRAILRKADLRDSWFDGYLSTVDAQGALFSMPTPDELRFIERGARKVDGLISGDLYTAFCRPGY